MNNYCTFYIVRHAQSEANTKDVITGQLETQLSKQGIKQAEDRAEELKEVHFSSVFSSDLIRARHTAEIIAKEHSLAVTALKILRERHYGSIQGQQGSRLSAELAKKLEDYAKISYKERLKAKIVPDMESDEEVIARFEAFLRETALAYQGKSILVVCHGNMMRTLLVHLGFASHAELGHGTIKNTGYFVVQSDGIEFKIIKTVGIEKQPQNH